MTPTLDSELRTLRRARRMGIVALADRAGVSKSALAAWETGTSRPRGPALARLLDALEAEPRLRARLLHLADPRFARVELAHSALGPPVDLGLVLRSMRERRGMTQADLARRVGVTQSAVARWETGDAAPSSETAHALSFALGAMAEEALALTSARGEGDAGLPDDPEAALHALYRLAVPEALSEVVSLGLEAELWRRAARDPLWDACLVQVLAYRANWLVTQERLDEAALPARRAVGMARTVEARVQAVAAVAALADCDRRAGQGHAGAAGMAGAWAEGLPDGQHRAWMLRQRGMCLARMGRGDEGTELVDRATELDARYVPPELLGDPWLRHTAPRCEARLAAGEARAAAALLGGRREWGLAPWLGVRVDHALGRAATQAEMAWLRHWIETRHWYPQRRRMLERIERRQAKLAGGEPVAHLPVPTDGETEDRLWAAVLRESRG